MTSRADPHTTEPGVEAPGRALRLLRELTGLRTAGLDELAEAVARKQLELQAALERERAERERMERVSTLKSNFLRVMSHELKGPLTALQLQVDLMEREAERAPDPRRIEGHDRIRRASRRLLHLADIMLEWARAESGRARLNPDRLNVAEVIEAAVAELSPQAKQKRLTIEVLPARELDPLVVTDRRLLGLVLVGLLSRAIAVSAAPTIAIHVTQRGRERRIEIRGAFPGLAEHGDPFTPLRTADSGSALALHVLRDLARVFEGEIAVETPSQPRVLALSLPSVELAALPGSSRPPGTPLQ